MSKVVLITEQLGEKLLAEIETASSIYVMTSFAMKSGVTLILPALQQAVARGAEVKICVGDYLYVTQPEALQLLVQLQGDNVELRLWQAGGQSFHPKVYLFEREAEAVAVIGSSNLSRSALTTGIEWNVHIASDAPDSVVQQSISEFLKLFYHEKTVLLNEWTVAKYAAQYEERHREQPAFVRQWTEAEEVVLTLGEHVAEQVEEASSAYELLQPRFAQAEALQSLTTTFEEGYNKALVVMATGLGKTYLAAFFAERFHRVLFIAHREEILRQAERSFARVLPERTSGIVMAGQKQDDAQLVFASIFTLSRRDYLQTFAPDAFDLIVIDEFHHAAAKSYDNVIAYFQPQFLLGLTATPDRNDSRDVYAICDGNVAYRIDFLTAIQRQWLAPFQYYGVYDDTDYTQLRWLGTGYDERQLAAVQLREEMAERIFVKWREHKQTRTIGFCSSIRQASFLAEYFSRCGVKAIALHSEVTTTIRRQAIEQLMTGELEVIFTVDLFNEGVDIPAVDTLLFVRPTESLTVFTQQMGRGLRIAEGKTHCVIIDLIGNYRNADVKLSLFKAEVKGSKKANVTAMLPQTCTLQLDVEAISLLAEMARKRQPRKDWLHDAYWAMKEERGVRPTYEQFALRAGLGEATVVRQEFESYVHFLYWLGELTQEEEVAFHRHELWFREVETTGMTKSYKMILLQAMLNRGPSEWYKPISAREVAPFFHGYLMEKEYRKNIDFADKSAQKLHVYDEKKVASLVQRMPMEKWSGNAPLFWELDEDILVPKLEVLPNDEVYVHQWTEQICQFRLKHYFMKKETVAINA